MKADLPNRHTRSVLFGILALILCTAGCAAVTVQPNVYRSDEYIIYRLQANDTPESMAQRFLGDAGLAWLIEDANRTLNLKPDQYAVIPLKPTNKGGIFETGVQQVPILCYHRFGNHCDSPLCVPEDIFEHQMKYLKDNGFRVITPEQLLAFLEYRRPLPRKSVMITVDDGYSSFYTVAYPILKKYGFTATLFVYTNFVGVSKKALSWDQLRVLKADGFTIGSHTIMHSDLSKRGDKESETEYIERLRHEVTDSKKIIDEKLNQNTFFFAYPFGRSNAAAMAITEQSGYKLAVTVRRGGNPFFNNPYSLKRDQILKRDMTTFESRLKTFKSLSLR